jgi:transposase-like protein
MRCLECGSDAATERPERTAQGYRRFRCRTCGKQFNERSGGVLNRTQYPSDVIALDFLRLRSRHHQHVPANCRRLVHLRRTVTMLAILQAA